MTAATAVAAERAMVGQPAPDFEMGSTRNIEKLNEPVKLSDYRGKWLVMVFYPLDFTFVCPTELTTFSDRYQDFVDIGADIIGISTDSVYSHRAWLNTSRDKGGVEGLKYPLAADATKQVAGDYGVLIQDNFELVGPTANRQQPPYRAHGDKLPLKLQDHGNPMRFRNIWVRNLE